MRIVVNNIAASTGGALTVLKDFYNCVRDNDTENEWIFLLNEKYFEESENVKIITLPQIKSNPVKKLMFDFFTGKEFIRKLDPDIIFSMQNIVTFGLKAPTVLYVHQPLPFQNAKKFSIFNKKERKLAFKQHIVGRIIKKSVRKADKVIVQTNWMKDSVVKKCGINADKVVNILPNLKRLTVPESVSFVNTNFFYPTSAVLYKNNGLIFEACDILKAKGLTHSVEITISEDKSTDTVKCIGRIPYEQVIAKYMSSTLLFPSYIETFGYPLAEARQLGTVILASDTEFSRELLAGYENAYFFDPFNANELAKLMEDVIAGRITKKPVHASTGDTPDSWKAVIDAILSLPS